MMSFSSSRQALILARRLRSRRGFVIFLYCMVLETGASPWWPGKGWGVKLMVRRAAADWATGGPARGTRGARGA